MKGALALCALVSVATTLGIVVALFLPAFEFFREVEDPDGDFQAGRQQIGNSSDFRTPANLVIADARPERMFVRTLCERGGTPKRGEFSPDFFIKQGDGVFVVEIKGDEEISDPSPENVKKHEFAAAHFQRLNEWLHRD